MNTAQPTQARFDGLTRDEAQLIHAIAKRASTHALRNGIRYDPLTADMDITACHLNGCPLDLPKLMNARDGDFGHDVLGIRRYINRTTGQLAPEFAPRCALAEGGAK